MTEEKPKCTDLLQNYLCMAVCTEKKKIVVPEVDCKGCSDYSTTKRTVKKEDVNLLYHTRIPLKLLKTLRKEG